MKFKIIFLIIFVLSIIAHAYLFHRGVAKLFPSYQLSGSKVEDLQKYSLLSPRVLQEYQNDTLINFLSLRNDLRKQTDPYGDSFGLYFEYLPTGSSIGINSQRSFYAASLIKVPIVMAFYHFKERTHFDDTKQVVISHDMVDKEFGDLWQKEGQKISFREAVTLSLTHSDNTASKVIRSILPEQDFTDVYTGLDIEYDLMENQAVLTAKEYSSILKALYFSSVLTKDDSQEILTLLSKSIFKDKLPAGISEDIVVAHKIGVLPGELYSDCGIIFIPRRPYILCMISGSDEDTARTRMKLASKKIFDYVSRVNK
jgi:beta-lactamase class A